MPDELEEIAKRYRDLHLKCAAGNYQEIVREDLYRDLSTIARRLKELEQRLAVQALTSL